jgi:hypothetical protein
MHMRGGSLELVDDLQAHFDGIPAREADIRSLRINAS